MKKIWIVIVNILIMASMVAFVFVYSNIENKRTINRQIDHFQSGTVTMEQVTENYLEGEQRICDVWANYINSEDMTIQEATSFIHISHVLSYASAHLIYKDTLTGLSTRESIIHPGDYNVSYSSIELFGDMSWIDSNIACLTCIRTNEKMGLS